MTKKLKLPRYNRSGLFMPYATFCVRVSDGATHAR